MLATWERATQWPMILAAVLFLGAYAWPVIDPSLPPETRMLCEQVVWATWIVFAGDYVVRLWLADDRLSFVKRNVIDLLSIILPMFRTLRMLRVVTLIQVLNRRAAHRLRGKIVTYVVGGASLLSFCASVAILSVERDAPDSTINTFADAAWWSITTMTTVGYGDAFPVTTDGRFIAAGLMIAGVALFGVVTGTLASYIVERVSEEADEFQDDAQELADEVRLLRAEIVRLREVTADR